RGDGHRVRRARRRVDPARRRRRVDARRARRVGAAPPPASATARAALALGHAEGAGVARARVRGPVELRRLPLAVADDLEPLAALPAGDRAETVAVHALEDRRPPPFGRPGSACLEVAVAPGEHELGALRPPAPEHALELRRSGRPGPPRLDPLPGGAHGAAEP